MICARVVTAARRIQAKSVTLASKSRMGCLRRTGETPKSRVGTTEATEDTATTVVSNALDVLGTSDPEARHTTLERGRLEPEPLRGPAGASDPPVGLLEHFANMFDLQRFERHGRLW